LKTLYLVDGTSQLFRAFYAIRGLTGPAGTPTNAVYGFTQMLRKLLEERTPEFLAVAFDRPEPTHRHRLFPSYKANRMAPPEDLVLQIPPVKQSCDVLGAPRVEQPGFEADDLIGTLARKAAEDRFEVVIVASDKDLFQLVGGPVRILHPVRWEWIDREVVIRTLGVAPEQVPDLLGLMGDSSDNIPGVPGIGEKGARDLIARFGSIEGCLEQISRIERRTYRENLDANRDKALLSRELARIRLDAPVEWAPDAYRRRPSDLEQARRFFADLGFARMLAEVEDAAPAAAPQPESVPPADLVEEASAVRRAIRELSETDRLAVVPRLSGPEPMRARLEWLGLGTPGTRVLIPIRGPEWADAGVEEDEALAALGSIVSTPGIRLLGEDLKPLCVYLLRRGLRLGAPLFDAGVAAYLLDPEGRRYDLGALESVYLGQSPPAAAGESGPEVPPEARRIEVRTESSRRCRILLELEGILRESLRRRGLERLYRDLEEPLLLVLARMEWNGIRVDVPYLKELAADWQRDLERIQQQVHEMAGEEFNLNSPKQLRDLLFGKLGLKPGRKTEKERSYSTGMDVLEELAPTHPLPGALLEYRSLAKLLSTYVEALPRLVNPETGRVHTSFSQTAAATGRLTSSSPNLQNIPIRTDRGRRIRRAFVVEPGRRLVVADYSQIELRVLAHLSGDEAMREAFRGGDDIHAATAARVFSVAKDLVTEEMRRQAKTINFGILYGMGPFRLGRQLGISTAAARRFIDSYFDRFAGVRSYVEEVAVRAERDGEVSTLLGRIRPVPEIRSRNAALRRQGVRVAVNTTIQGSAADLIKLAMVRLHADLQEAGMGTRLVLQVHDELLLECPEAEVPEASRRVREAMEGALSLEVPLVADVRSGPNWLEAG
jgi:DNA polymerase-1